MLHSRQYLRKYPSRFVPGGPGGGSGAVAPVMMVVVEVLEVVVILVVVSVMIDKVLYHSLGSMLA